MTKNTSDPIDDIDSFMENTQEEIKKIKNQLTFLQRSDNNNKTTLINIKDACGSIEKLLDNLSLQITQDREVQNKRFENSLTSVVKLTQLLMVRQNVLVDLLTKSPSKIESSFLGWKPLSIKRFKEAEEKTLKMVSNEREDQPKSFTDLVEDIVRESNI